MARSSIPFLAYALMSVFSGCGLILDLGADIDGGAVEELDVGLRLDARASDGPPPRDAGSSFDASADAFADARGIDARVDAATVCPLPCGLVTPQCGCAPSQACNVDGTAGVSCVLPGSAGPGAYCMRETECDRGLTCIWIAGARNGVCVAFCDDDSDCGDPRSRCTRIGPTDQAGVCSFACDPLDDASCPSDVQACDIVLRTTFEGAPSAAVTVCRTAGATPVGEACGTTSECVARSVCRGGGCRPFCDVAAPACPAGSSCTVQSPPWRIGTTEYGLCE